MLGIDVVRLVSADGKVKIANTFSVELRNFIVPC